jgi:choline transport protein
MKDDQSLEHARAAGIEHAANDRQSLNDEQLLAALGHKQELRREFSIWSLGCLCLCLMATWEALSSVVAAALISGGAPCLFYN